MTGLERLELVLRRVLDRKLRDDAVLLLEEVLDELTKENVELRKRPRLRGGASGGVV